MVRALRTCPLLGVWLCGFGASFCSGLSALALVTREEPQWRPVLLLLGALLSSTFSVGLCLRYFAGGCLILTQMGPVDLSAWLDLRPASPQSPFPYLTYFFFHCIGWIIAVPTSEPLVPLYLRVFDSLALTTPEAATPFIINLKRQDCET